VNTKIKRNYKKIDRDQLVRNKHEGDCHSIAKEWGVME
jgi:hypothetical protein